MRTIPVALLAAALAAGCGGGAERAQDHLKAGAALNAEGKHEAAVAELTKAVAASRESVDAHTELGNAYRALKQYDRAFEAYAAAKKADRWATRPHLENARALVETGQVEPAISQLTLLVELDPKHLEALILLGQVSMLERPLADGQRGVPPASVERAELNLDAAVALKPDSLAAHHGLAQARERLGKKEDARASWTRVRELAGADARLAAEAEQALARLKR
jgi:tetratricopeptide (TPR) repeat protein